MDKAIYIQLVAEHRDRIYSQAYYSLRDTDDAADITQETFLRLWRYNGEISSQGAKAWLIRVCHNLCIDQTRKTKTVRTHFGFPDHEAVHNLNNPVEKNLNPESRYFRQQRQETLLESLAILPTETRSIIMMHYFQDLKLQEISTLLDLKISTIKVRLHRARKCLKNHFTENNLAPLFCKREIG